MTNIELDTLYGVNKELYKKIVTPSEKELSRQFKQVGAWFSSIYQSVYFMLLCREKYDFTIFRINNSNYFEAVQELKEVLESRGTIVEVVYSHEHKFYECWIRDENDEIFMYAFFPCDDWVIEVE